MNIDTVAGEGTIVKGRIKENLGDATGDPLLQRDGMMDQAAGSLRQGFGGLREFVRRQPLAAALIAGLAGALFLGGRQRRRRG